jgi:hypothetical protein
MAHAIGDVNDARSWKRRTWLVDRGFQLKLGVVMAAVAALVAVLLGVVLEGSYARAIAAAGLDYASRRVAEADHRVLLIAFVGVAAAGVIGLGFVGVLLTHRVAGPAVLMRRYLASLGQGRYPRIRSLRKGDELNDLFITVAETIERVRQRDVQQIELLEEALEVMRGAVARSPELKPVIEALEHEVADRREILDLGADRPPADPAPGP